MRLMYPGVPNKSYQWGSIQKGKAEIHAFALGALVAEWQRHTRKESLETQRPTLRHVAALRPQHLEARRWAWVDFGLWILGGGFQCGFWSVGFGLWISLWILQ